jgi:hypothetical protein
VSQGMPHRDNSVAVLGGHAPLDGLVQTGAAAASGLPVTHGASGHDVLTEGLHSLNEDRRRAAFRFTTTLQLGPDHVPHLRPQ